MIDSSAVAMIIGAISTCWALGWSMGTAVAWVRAIRNVT